MILLVDNYDSFVFNLARYFERLGCARRKRRKRCQEPFPDFGGKLSKEKDTAAKRFLTPFSRFFAHCY